MRTLLLRINNLTYIILFFLISCATNGEYRDLLPKEERTALLTFDVFLLAYTENLYFYCP